MLKAKEKVAYEKSDDYLRQRIKCPNCGKFVSRMGLANHVKDAGCGA
jgi:ribosomal protein S27AE